MVCMGLVVVYEWNRGVVCWYWAKRKLCHEAAPSLDQKWSVDDEGQPWLFLAGRDG